MSTDNTVQTNLDGEKVYPHKCKWCGKPFTKQHNRQEYCSDECFQYARQEQKAIYQRKRRKLINNNELVSNESRHLAQVFSASIVMMFLIKNMRAFKRN